MIYSHQEAATDEHEQGGAPLAPHPLRPFFTLRVDPPLDLQRLTVARVGRSLKWPSSHP
ncbi:hypothetical protein ABZY45_07225 [Streptomyces sp. NPDC006516]|uniref:hypothetical protein n=1 Tax=Streptomyces sp. NPDC006516 TaxID=3154309 RepID=UPI0033A7A32E